MTPLGCVAVWAHVMKHCMVDEAPRSMHTFEVSSATTITQASQQTPHLNRRTRQPLMHEDGRT